MRNFFCFWWQCTKFAAKGIVPLVRSWWWFLAIPVLGGLRYIAAGRNSEMILPNHSVLDPIIDGVVFTVAGFVAVCGGAFIIRLLNAPVAFYKRERNRAEVSERVLISSLKPKIGIQIDKARQGVANISHPTHKWVQFIVAPVTAAPLVRCEAWVKQIERLNADNESSASLVEEPVRCEWSQRTEEERLRVTIPAGLSQRANLFFVSEEKGPIPLMEPAKPTLATEITTSGRYRISVVVTADDAPPETASFLFECQSFRNVWLAQE